MTTTTSSTTESASSASTKPVKAKATTASRVEKVKELMPQNFEALLQKARDLPHLIESEVKSNPYRTLGVAVGVGFGLGAVMSSRIARLLLVTAGGYAVNEVARTHIKRFVDELAKE
jgi:ElaB/YqjD/DUF883 family membrane-anchored ribosome-binding protein